MFLGISLTQKWIKGKCPPQILTALNTSENRLKRWEKREEMDKLRGKLVKRGEISKNVTYFPIFLPI